MKALAYGGMHEREGEVFRGFRLAGLDVEEKEIGSLEEGDLEDPDVLFVFTVCFSPGLSGLCMEKQMPYLSYILGWPEHSLYDPAVKNPCNYVFCMDGEICRKLQSEGLERVFHLPAGTGAEHTDRAAGPQEGTQEEGTPIVFVDPQGDGIPDREGLGLSEYTKGYLDALGAAQMEIYGSSLLEGALGGRIREELEQCLSYKRLPEGSPGTDRAVLADSCVARWVTERETERLLSLLSGRFPGQVARCERGAPTVKANRICIVPSPRSLRSGVPVQVYDILAAGGFVIAGFQAEVPELFQPGVEIETFSSGEELLEKTGYYLEHEGEGERIAEAGRKAVADYHTFTHRAVTMFNTVFRTDGTS